MTKGQVLSVRIATSKTAVAASVVDVEAYAFGTFVPGEVAVAVECAVAPP